MPSDPISYTPAQYLEAGYRAEQAGDRDRAAQYYVYVADAFPETPEGEAARGGLVRIGAAARPEPHAQPQAQAQAREAAQQPGPARAAPAGETGEWTAGAAASAARATTQPARPASHAAPHGAGGQPHPQSSQQPASPAATPIGYAQPSTANANQQRIVLGDLARLKLSPGAGPPSTEQQPAAPHRPDGGQHHADAAHQEPMRLPDVVTRRARELAEADAYAPPPKYRGGRLMARLFVWVGWLTVAGGIAEIVLAILFGAGPANLGLGATVGAVIGLAVVVSGLTIVLIGQLALAVFDGSNAVREMAAIMRARSDL